MPWLSEIADGLPAQVPRADDLTPLIVCIYSKRAKKIAQKRFADGSWQSASVQAAVALME